jgi:hypothetical protein
LAPKGRVFLHFDSAVEVAGVEVQQGVCLRGGVAAGGVAVGVVAMGMVFFSLVCRFDLGFWPFSGFGFFGFWPFLDFLLVY